MGDDTFDIEVPEFAESPWCARRTEEIEFYIGDFHGSWVVAVGHRQNKARYHVLRYAETTGDVFGNSRREGIVAHIPPCDFKRQRCQGHHEGTPDVTCPP